MDEAVESVRALLRVAVPAMKPVDPTVRALARLASDATAAIDPDWWAMHSPLWAERYPEEFTQFVIRSAMARATTKADKPGTATTGRKHATKVSRLAARIAAKPADTGRDHYPTPGSQNRKK